jgi:hypothetical protein
MQALPRHDRIEIRVLAQGAPIGLTQGRRPLFAAFSLRSTGLTTATESIANLRGLRLGLTPFLLCLPGNNEGHGPHVQILEQFERSRMVSAATPNTPSL